VGTQGEGGCNSRLESGKDDAGEGAGVVTRTIRTSLGTSALTGKQGIDQTLRFKEQLLFLHPKPEHVNLLTVTDSDTHQCGAEALYDADDPNAAAWVQQAEAVSGELWQKLTQRRKGVAKA
jgi:hypothetical protein